MRLKNVRRAAVSLVAVTIVMSAGAGTADAAPKKFIVDVAISDNGAAVATVTDTIVPSNYYMITLTAAGGGACGITLGDTIDLHPAVLTPEPATGAGNPAIASTPGAQNCRAFGWASMTYTLTWVGLVGTTGQLQVECTWVFFARTCTPSHFEGDASVLPI